MNPRVQQVTESPTIRITDLAREIERRGQKVIKLQAGDPDFATPPAVLEAAQKAMHDGFTHYAASRGLPELRVALAEKLQRENGIEADPETEILVTHGAAHAIFITMQTLLAPGEEVILIEPFYPSYASSVRLAGGVPVTVETDPRNDFDIDIDRVRACLSPRSRLIVLNSPCNPTGKLLSHSEIRCLAELAIEHDLYVLCDDVYEKLIYDGTRHTSVAALPAMRERTITINSFSKTYAMTGWRVGYLAAPSRIVEHMLKVLQYSATNIAPFSQRAALVALTAPEINDYTEMMRGAYDQRRLAGIAAVAAIDGLRALRPQGAFYLMLDVSRFGQDSTEFAYHLLEKTHVAVVPGVAFGRSAEGWLRLTFAVDQDTFIEGIRRIGQFMDSDRR